MAAAVACVVCSVCVCVCVCGARVCIWHAHSAPCYRVQRQKGGLEQRRVLWLAMRVLDSGAGDGMATYAR